MASRYAVTRTINADPERIWALLSDTTTYANWNTAVVSVSGDIRAGEKISLVSIVDPKRTFKLTVAEVDPPRKMVWSDGMPLGLFKGVRTYTLTPRGDQTEFSMVEEFSGPLAPLITKAIPDMTDSFNQWADGLKKASEGT